MAQQLHVSLVTAGVISTLIRVVRRVRAHWGAPTAGMLVENCWPGSYIDLMRQKLRLMQVEISIFKFKFLVEQTLVKGTIF